MAQKTSKWDVTQFLDSEDRIALFLEAVFEDGDPALIQAAIGDVARARGMTDLAKSTGLAREALYRSLSETGNPEFATIMKVIKAMNMKITVKADDQAANERDNFAEARLSA